MKFVLGTNEVFLTEYEVFASQMLRLASSQK